jgi:hypothetical protein
MVSMEITGTETVDGIRMCRAVADLTSAGSEAARIEYLWSEDGKSFYWTSYDSSGAFLSEMKMKNGVFSVTDAEGHVVASTTG